MPKFLAAVAPRNIDTTHIPTWQWCVEEGKIEFSAHQFPLLSCQSSCVNSICQRQKREKEWDREPATIKLAVRQRLQKAAVRLNNLIVFDFCRSQKISSFYSSVRESCLYH